MEVAPRYWQSPETLRDLYVSTSGASAAGTQGTQLPYGTVVVSTKAAAAPATNPNAQSARNAAINALAASGKSSASSGASVSTNVETMVPLSAFASWGPGNTPLGVNHQGMFVAATLSFNLPPGKSLGNATAAIKAAEARIHMPATVHGAFAGTAAAFQSSIGNELVLIGAALAAVYIVLGVLYESYVHPLTIISTLPSAGVGAVLALLLFGQQFTIIAMIGVILLIGIVKKNAIMMIDFAIQAERAGATPRDAISEACRLRFRPIMMTTAAAMLGALPLAFGTGEGAELRTPLGISIVGGLLMSQALTLYTTPVVYLYLDRLGLWARRRFRAARTAGTPSLPGTLPGTPA
jgi:multidrug efflux pump